MLDHRDDSTFSFDPSTLTVKKLNKYHKKKIDSRKGVLLASYSRKKTRKRKKGKENDNNGNKQNQQVQQSSEQPQQQQHQQPLQDQPGNQTLNSQYSLWIACEIRHQKKKIIRKSFFGRFYQPQTVEARSESQNFAKLLCIAFI